MEWYKTVSFADLIAMEKYLVESIEMDTTGEVTKQLEAKLFVVRTSIRMRIANIPMNVY